MKNRETLGRFSICLLLLAAGCSGGGSSGPSASLSLSWDDSAENADGSTLTDLAGYNVYYGESSGDYSQVINVGNTTSYVVSLRPATTYYLSVTAYDHSGNESAFSEEITAAVP